MNNQFDPYGLGAGLLGGLGQQIQSQRDYMARQALMAQQIGALQQQYQPLTSPESDSVLLLLGDDE